MIQSQWNKAKTTAFNLEMRVVTVGFYKHNTNKHNTPHTAIMLWINHTQRRWLFLIHTEYSLLQEQQEKKWNQ